MTFTAGEIVSLVQSVLWPFLRAVGLFLVAPVFGAAVVPARVKVILALTLAFLIMPFSTADVPVEPLGARMLLIAANQILIGVALAFIVQVIFEALMFAGQTIATTMGLGYATLLDPQRGASVPVVSQFLLVMGVLLFLALDGHLALIELFAESFQWLPVSDAMFPAVTAHQVVVWGGRIFATGLMVGLPAIAALIIVNLALGIVSRAAPSLNLFSVGFPVSLGLGFLIVVLSLKNLDGHFASALQASLEAARAVLSSAVAQE